ALGGSPEPRRWHAALLAPNAQHVQSHEWDEEPEKCKVSGASKLDGHCDAFLTDLVVQEPSAGLVAVAQNVVEHRLESLHADAVDRFEVRPRDALPNVGSARSNGVLSEHLGSVVRRAVELPPDPREGAFP